MILVSSAPTVFRRIRTFLWVAVACTSMTSTALSFEDKAPLQSVDAPMLKTRFAADVSPEHPWPEYPRPQMVRKDWKNLNGKWDYAVVPRGSDSPKKYDGKILVPFPIESALSGVRRTVGSEHELWYRTTISIPPDQRDQTWLLNFGAVDWLAKVYLNGKLLTEHQGGYDGFTVNLSNALKAGVNQELVVQVWDPSDQGFQPRGKQVTNPGGIWYTSVTGIWQTVWLESVPKTYIESLEILPDVDRSMVSVTVRIGGTDQAQTVRVLAYEAGQETGNKAIVERTGKSGEPIELKIAKPRLWSPDDPYLYPLRIELDGGDTVSSYVGMRKIEMKQDEKGHLRMFLNNRPLFQFGLLDQGWWPDGLYLAPTDEALKSDIEMTKKLGFNMCRKHVKVEPQRWYFHCDRLGLLVWQDMPNGDRHIRPDEPDIQREKESSENYYRELEQIIEEHSNHPSIVTWVPFNEGWGQFDTDEVLAWVKRKDPTRLVDGPSGWTDRGSGDLRDLHLYPGPGMPPLESARTAVLGEYGGLGLPQEGHLWVNKDNWGYRTFNDIGELNRAYRDLLRKLRGLQIEGLAAAIYTQTTDVEVEVNGVITYDREVIKLDEESIAMNRQLTEPVPGVRVILPTAEKQGAKWRYTLTQPRQGWSDAKFDADSWEEGESGFGTEGTPGTIVRTTWDTPDIWLRREFELPPDQLWNLPALRVHHDEDAEVYLNGEKIAELRGYSIQYTIVPLEAGAKKALKQGKNILAVHCRQTGGGQYIDVGLASLEPHVEK